MPRIIMDTYKHILPVLIFTTGILWLGSIFVKDAKPHTIVLIVVLILFCGYLFGTFLKPSLGRSARVFYNFYYWLIAISEIAGIAIAGILTRKRYRILYFLVWFAGIVLILNLSGMLGWALYTMNAYNYFQSSKKIILDSITAGIYQGIVLVLVMAPYIVLLFAGEWYRRRLKDIVG